jgi:hypothetical protein
VLRYRDVTIMNVLDQMTQRTLKISSPHRYTEPSITSKSIHSPCVSGFPAVFCPELLAIATAGFTLAAFVHSLDRTTLLDVFTLEAG